MIEPRPFYHRFAWAYDLLQSEDVKARMDFIESVLSELGISNKVCILDAG